MADLQERLAKLKKVEQRERFQTLVLKIRQIIDSFSHNTFQLYDEDLDSIKEDSILAAAQELKPVMTEARRLQRELGD